MSAFSGKMAWSKKLEEELTTDQLNADRNVRQAAYIPTFFTSQENHAALQASRWALVIAWEHQKV